MGLLSIFKRQPGAVAAAAGANAVQGAADARTRAKRRLLGAVVLLGIGVIAFPLLFETQPRPIPVDIAIEIPRKDGAPPLSVPPARQVPPVPASSPVSAAPVIAEPTPEAAKPPAAVPPAEPKVEAAAKALESPVKAAPTPMAEAKRPVPAEVKATVPADATGRFVVQIGAYANANVAREARAKVEKLGLRTYTQTADTDGGKRIRVRLGPYATREEADQAAAKVKAAGLPAAVLVL